MSIFHILDFGYTLWQYIQKKSPVWARRYLWLMTGLLVATFGLMGYVFFTNQYVLLYKAPMALINNLAAGISTTSQVDRFFITIFKHAGLLLGYLVFISFPATVFFVLLRRQVVDSRPKLKAPPRQTFLKFRRAAGEEAYLAGIDARTGEPIYIDDDARMEHTQIVGVTGGGKTEGGIIPALVHDIAWGRGSIIIDMKGDRMLLEKVAAAVIAAGRKDDLLLFSLADPRASQTYNPLMRGNSSEIKDKIISSNIWSEVFYKKTSEIATQGICHALQALGRPVTFQSLLEYLRDVKKVEAMKQELDQKGVPNSLESLLCAMDGKTRDLTGLIADLTAIVGSEFGPLMAEDQGEIDLLDAYQNKKIVLFQLNTGLYQETAIRLARIIMQDIKTVSNHIQSYYTASERHFFSVFIDEFASIAFDAFIELISKARSAKIAVSIAHQSLGDLKNAGEGFQNQIFDNTNTRIVYRQNSAESRDLITKMAGTVEKEKITYQTSAEQGMNVHTGMGSIRVVEAFQVDPNLITEFPTGFCALLQHKKSGRERIRYMKSDFIDIGRPADFLRERMENARRLEPEMPLSEILEEVKEAPELDPLKHLVGIYP